MAAGTTQMFVSAKAAEGLVEFAKKAVDLTGSSWNIRSQLEQIDRDYMMEGNADETHQRAKLSNKLGDKKKLRDITVPIVMPQVESALGYMNAVFLSGYPIFGVAGDPRWEDAALQLQTIVGENCQQAKWLRQFIMFFRDGLKYNLQGMEVDWEQRTTYSVETRIDKKEADLKEVIWQGNTMRRMDLYNTVFDPRVAPAEIHERGEFAGYLDVLSRVEMKRFINNLHGKISPSVAVKAFESGIGGSDNFQYYTPTLNPEALTQGRRTDFDWMAWVTAAQSQSTIAYKNMYTVLKLYARILPADFGLIVPQANTPQVWKLIIVNGQVLLYAERMTNAHGYIPIIFGQPIEDGLGFQTKSFAQNVTGMQDAATALWAADLASKRKLVFDRMLYDPSRIREADINNPNPASKIPVRPSAYGKNLSEAVYPIPYRDELSATITQHSDMIVRFANLVNNQNPAQQGQFVKGNKTLHEYQDIMGHSNSRNQTLALSTEYGPMMPIKEIVLTNILQYQTETVLYNQEKQQEVKVDPLTLRKALLKFKVSDGMIPLDKQMSTEELSVAMQTLGSSPQLASGYDVTGVFSYIMKLRGADLKPFEKPQAIRMYEQQLMAWQQAAAEAAKTGAVFSTPMPQPPNEQQLAAEAKQKEEANTASLQTLLTQQAGAQ